MAAELADAASCSSDTTAPDPVPAALYLRLYSLLFIDATVLVSAPTHTVVSTHIDNCGIDN